MKNFIILAIALAFLGACNSGPKNEIEILKKEKDSLKEVKGSIAGRMAEIEARLAEIDTTEKSYPLVSTAKPQVGQFEHFFKVYGNLETDQSATIYPEISGTITRIVVKEGQSVSKGDLLVQLDVEIMRQQEEELKTRMELAEITYEKQKKLWDKKIGSEMQYLQAKNNRDALRKSLASIQAQIAKGRITAPYPGIVDEIFPKEGEVAMPGMGILRLVNLSNMYVEADISENYLGRVKAGDKVKISVPSLGVDRTSTIKRVGQYINPNNRTFKIRVDVPNQDQLLKPNLVALIQVNDYHSDTTVVLPTNLIMEGFGNQQYVFVVKDSAGFKVARKQAIETGLSYEGQTEITKGLNGNETLVNKGARSIKNGELVEIAQ